MKMRAPATPLLLSDPYFSVWSMSDTLNGDVTCHWTGKPQPITGVLSANGKEYCFMGVQSGIPAMLQVSCEITACSTEYRFEADAITLTVTFTSPLLLDRIALTSRPVVYMNLHLEGAENAEVRIFADDSLCLDLKGADDTVAEVYEKNGLAIAKVGSKTQPILNKCGDDLRIEWGYFYLATGKKGALVSASGQTAESGREAHELQLTAPLSEADDTLVLFAYDDVKSLVYFEEELLACWKKEYADIEEAMCAANAEYSGLKKECDAFSAKMWADAVNCGGEDYAELLALAYRQAIAAHKLCYDTKGDVLFVSKECFSNGCAATVDVSYPSIPLFLLYNPELVNGMMRPIFRFARTELWPYDFAPHDSGRYPIMNGQAYGGIQNWANGVPEFGVPVFEKQMPLEECGNMLVMAATSAMALGSTALEEENWDLLSMWANTLARDGADPANQLCTDDFAGHLAGNCNLTLKAIMGMESFAILNRMTGKEEEALHWEKLAKEMADGWVVRAKKADGTYKLAFDQEDTFSLKYNLIWDKVFGSGIFNRADFEKEFRSYIDVHCNKYGTPLDNRSEYTKSDWLVWSANWFEDDAAFAKMIAPLWNAYNESESRVPMTDWYWTNDAKQRGFQNRTVQGGLFIRLLDKSGKLKLTK